MAIRFGNVNPTTFRVGTLTPTRIFLGTNLVWPEIPTPETIFSTAGAYTYNIPAGARFIDVILLGGGGGGRGMALADAWGKGGDGGTWQSVTLERGVHIPWSTTQITGTVGAGGTAGAGSWGFGNGGPGGDGGATTAAATGWAGLSAAGGAGGKVADITSVAGKSPGNRTHNSRTYTGGAQQNMQSTAGNPPGGGGCGAQTSTNPGGAGARGQAWFFAYA
ncbi:hypothetical protein SEA_POCAHONTAS_5 [Mycobacterium phage Pocahontas]|nr:hypothetical protein SEA_POCAHONTAS_5 [Mycobacterium phage Pocahontas]